MINLIYIIFILLIIGLIYLFIRAPKIELTPQEAIKAINKGFFDVIVDVRSKDEWDESHHPLAIHIPINELVYKLPEKVPDKESSILFYCKLGIRASGTIEMAKKLGYKNVKYLDGRFVDL
jgi:phage shock protein E